MSDFLYYFYGSVTGVLLTLMIADDSQSRHDVCEEVKYYHPEIKLVSCKEGK